MEVVGVLRICLGKLSLHRCGESMRDSLGLCECSYRVPSGNIRTAIVYLTSCSEL